MSTTTENKTAIYVTNLGKYNEGYLIGEWLPLPADADEIEACLERIGINEYYEEYFITDFDDYTDFNLYDIFGEYSQIEAISDFVETVENLDDYQKKIISVLVNDAGYEIEEAIEKEENGGVYFWKGDSMAEVAEYMLEEFGDLDRIPDDLRQYFDFEAYGRMLETCGSFYLADDGYVEIVC